MIKGLPSLSGLALIGANLVPLFGVLFFDWNAILVLALFWAENLVVGLFNFLKMLIVSIRARKVGGFFKSGFFMLHYGIFCAGHGTILWEILELGELKTSKYLPNVGPGLMELYSSSLVVLLSFIDMFGSVILLGLAALVLSHLVSFIENFILRGGIFKHTVDSLMGKPYPRIFVLHIGLILGALALEKLGSPVWLLALIVLFKIIADFALYQRRHEKDSGSITDGSV